MSHTAEIKTEFLDLAVLKDTFEELNWRIHRDTTMRTYAKSGMDATAVYPYVAVNPNPGYDVGIKEVNGAYVLYTDMYGGSVAQTLGMDLRHLRQGYTFNKTKKEVLFLGASIEREGYTENGDLIINITE